MVHDTVILKNYISKSNVEIINFYILEHLKNPNTTNNAGWATYYSVGKEVEDLLNSILPKLENEILGIHYYESVGISGPHSDKGYTKGGRTFIIPLEQCNGHTIVFNQLQEMNIYNDTFFTDAPNVNEPISKEDISRYLSNLSDIQLQKLSIETIFSWNTGDVLIFDRKKIHCSDDFVKNNIKQKRGLVIWSEV